MKQLVQSLRDGTVELLEVPSPAISPNHVLIKTHRSVISTGTEKMVQAFAEANWIQRIQDQPERVNQVIAKAQTDGIPATIEAIGRRMDEPVLLGYANAGVVVAVGAGVTEIAVGDRVASTGPHAEFVSVPRRLAVKIPPNVSFDDACFASLTAICLHAFRLSNVEIGSTVGVVGLGLLGRLTAQIARSAGCKVVGIEKDPVRTSLAKKANIEVRSVADMESTCDAVIVATDGAASEPIDAAIVLSRRKGHIVLLGTADISLSRTELFEKEITFQVSRSLGPGRYLPDYETHARDFDIGDVRWTQGRNIEAALQLMQAGDVRPMTLDLGVMPHNKAGLAYAHLDEERHLLSYLLSYPEEAVEESTIAIPTVQTFAQTTSPKVGIVGAGNFADAVLLPELREAATVMSIASQGGVSAARIAKKYDVPVATTDVPRMLNRQDIEAVFIATRHSTHSDLAMNALRAGKHVYVEKPLAINLEQLSELEAVYRTLRKRGSHRPVLTVGTNRRFAPITNALREKIDGARGRHFLCHMNEAPLPENHWVLDPKIGGGIVVGTMIHHIDWVQSLAQSRVDSWSVAASDSQNVHVLLSFENSDVATIVYTSNGDRGLPKERLEVICRNEHWVVDNFRVLRRAKESRLLRRFSGQQDKGHRNAIVGFLEACGTGDEPIPSAQLFAIARIAIEIQDAL